MAEQEEPVRRRVALKVIKLGMDTKQVIARFEAERQALALMDHPNIAKVLDAGTTDSPLPVGRGEGQGGGDAVGNRHGNGKITHDASIACVRTERSPAAPICAPQASLA